MKVLNGIQKYWMVRAAALRWEGEVRWTGSESRAGRRAGHLLLPGLLPLPGKSWKNGEDQFWQKFWKKRNVWSPTDCYKAHCRWRGGPTFRSSSWKELDTAKRVGQTGSREIPVDLALAQWNRALLTRKRFWLKRKRISEVEFLPTMHIGHSEYLHGLHFSASLRHPIPYCNLVLM